MLCLKTSELEDIDSDCGARCVIPETMSSFHDGIFSLKTSQGHSHEPKTLNADGDGFTIHAACWRIFLEAHRVTVSDKRSLSLDEVEFTMMCWSLNLTGYDPVNGGDEGAYSGAGQYQGQEWTPETVAEVNYPSCHRKM